MGRRIPSGSVDHAAGHSASVDLLDPRGSGPLWGMASGDLNATLLAWPPGHRVDDHVNSELDVLLVGLEGDGVVTIDGREHALRTGSLVLIEKGSSRMIRAGEAGVRYLSVHRRRGPLRLTDARTQRIEGPQ